MTIRKELPKSFSDIEKRHETVADSFTDGDGRELLTVRLAGLWSDLIRVADERRDPEGQHRSPAVVPLLDDMKGILQWD